MLFMFRDNIDRLPEIISTAYEDYNLELYISKESVKLTYINDRDNNLYLFSIQNDSKCYSLSERIEDVVNRALNYIEVEDLNY